MVEVAAGLQTVHPNPGPRARHGRRDRGVAGRRGRCIRRYARRGVRRQARIELEGRVRQTREREVVTWNVQRMSLRDHNRRRLRRVLGYIGRRGWEIVLMTEVSADGEGVLWFGEDEDQVAVVHGRKAAIVLRGEALRLWIEGGQKRWLEAVSYTHLTLPTILLV